MEKQLIVALNLQSRSVLEIDWPTPQSLCDQFMNFSYKVGNKFGCNLHHVYFYIRPHDTLLQKVISRYDIYKCRLFYEEEKGCYGCYMTSLELDDFFTLLQYEVDYQAGTVYDPPKINFKEILQVVDDINEFINLNGIL